MYNRQADFSAKLIIFLSVLLFAIFILWAKNTHLDMVTRGQGRVVVTGQNHKVQVAQRGMITKFHVAVGDTVEKDQVLAEVNPIEARAQLGEIFQRLETMRFRLARLDAELNGQAFDVVLPDDPEMAILIAAERSLMTARGADLAAKENALRQAQQQKERELDAVGAELTGAIQSEALLKQESDQILPLVKLGALGVSEKFRLERDANSLQTQQQILGEKIRALEFSISETKAQIEAIKTGYHREILSERTEVLGLISELSERLPSLSQRVEQTEIRSPVSGTINQVFYNIAGAVVSEGEAIAEIVPNDGKLLVEALILPEDIANVEPGQPARISLTAYDASRFGTIDGTVLRVSADASFREETQTRMFVVEASMETDLLDADKNPVAVLPGMVAQVDIVRGERSVLEYFWNPIAKVRDKAFRE